MADTLLRLSAGRGTPRFVRPGNGPQFVAKHLMRALAGRGVEARHIDPGSPWQNGRNERFNGTLRDECLNLETFHNRDHARALVKLFGRHYDERRPHSARTAPAQRPHSARTAPAQRPHSARTAPWAT